MFPKNSYTENGSFRGHFGLIIQQSYVNNIKYTKNYFSGKNLYFCIETRGWNHRPNRPRSPRPRSRKADITMIRSIRIMACLILRHVPCHCIFHISISEFHINFSGFHIILGAQWMSPIWKATQGMMQFSPNIIPHRWRMRMTETAGVFVPLFDDRNTTLLTGQSWGIALAHRGRQHQMRRWYRTCQSCWTWSSVLIGQLRSLPEEFKLDVLNEK